MSCFHPRFSVGKFFSNSFLSWAAPSHSRQSMRCQSALAFLIVAFGSLVVINPAQAITIDTLETPQSIEAFVGIPDSSTVSSNTSIGGFRSMNAEVTGGSGRVVLSVLNDPGLGRIIDHSQTLTAQGVSTIHWDGNSNAASIDPTGLGGIDLTEDLGTAIVFEQIVYDATAAGVTITVRLYDASDASGQTYSDLALDLPVGGSGQQFSLPFNSPAATGSNGAADPTNVGAISIIVTGDISGADLGIKGFVTNGNCPLIPPKAGKVLDECGQCIPPSDPLYNQSCVDCLGVPNGTTLPGDSCDTGEEGPCEAGIYNTSCDCERIVDPTVEVCDGADNNCNGEIDEVFPQLGDICGTSQGDCEVSGIYICDPKGGVVCDIDLDNANFDDCDPDIGCDGIPGSGTVPDECGVCGGDGSSCSEFECNSVDISELLFELDGGAKEQEALVRTVTKIVKRHATGRKKKISQYVEDVRDEAHVLQITNWRLIWTVPRINVQCSSLLAADYCVIDDNSVIVDEYVGRSAELRDLGLQAVKRMRRVTKNPKLVRRWKKRMNNRHNTNLEIAAQVPETQTVCTSFSPDENQ